MKRILGIGNALVDIMTELENDLILNELGLPKGSMQLVDIEKSLFINDKTGNLPKKMAAGGSASNTIYGLAKLGVPAGFIGKVGNDETGNFFYDDLVKNNITPVLLRSDDRSGLAMALVSKDAERTFATYLGAAISLSDTDLISDMFKGYDILHVEGYLVQNHLLLTRALELAKENNLKISLDLASFNVVEDNLDFLKEIVSKYIDIIFANEEEAKSFTGKDPLDALEDLSENCEYAVVKIGKNGSLVKYAGEITKVGVIESSVVDSTGAGDLYAAGFLFGLTNNYTVQKCATTGTILAGKVIENFGARIHDDTWLEITRLIKEIE